MKLSTIFVLFLTLALLTSCGGGGTQVAEGGIGGTGISMGRVSGFGSIYVNGVKYDTSSTSYIYEGAAAVSDDSGIAVGMVVTVTGSNDGVTGVAETVAYAKLLQGTLSVNNIASNETGTLVAMGQTISVDADTVYDDNGLPPALSDLPLGAVIEVSGFTDGSGTILATRIEVESLGYNGETLEVKGLVDQLDTLASSFRLGSLEIDYSAAALAVDELTDGLYVEAKGTLVSDSFMLASVIEIEDDGDLVIAGDGAAVELEGIVTAILSSGSDGTLFFLNGQQVLADGQTQFEPEGSGASSILLDQPLEASGVMEGTLLVAAEIELKTTTGDKEELEAVIESVDVGDNSITLLGQRVRTSVATIFEDETSDTQAFSLDSLSPGDYLSIDLFVAADGVFEASKLERDELPAEGASHAEIEGFVDEVIDAQTIRVVDVRVDISDPSLNLAVQPGDRIEIAGDYLSGTLFATSANIENDFDSD